MNNPTYIYDVTIDNFASVVIENSNSVPVLVDLWAEWCQPCKALMPTLAKLAEEYQGKFILAKINTEEQQELASKFGVRSIPAVKMFMDGTQVDEFMGALPESEIRKFLDRHIPKESDNLIHSANQLIQQGMIDDAIKLVEQAKNSDPDNPRTLIAYARLKATLGETELAEETLAALPVDQQQTSEAVGLRAQLMFDRVALAAPEIDLLEKSIQTKPDDSELRYQLAARMVMEGEHEKALEQLLWILQKDPAYGDDAARKGLLSLFDILGPDHPLTGIYRSRMFAALH